MEVTSEAGTASTRVGAGAEVRGAAGRSIGSVDGVMRITVTPFGSCWAIVGWPASGMASWTITFGKTMAAAPPSTASATVTARANINLMQLPLAAENPPTATCIGSETGN